MQRTHLYAFIITVIYLCTSPQIMNAETFTVTSTADSGDGSLRQAIRALNELNGPHMIRFNIQEEHQDEVHKPLVITLSSVLPKIAQTVFIDGYSQRDTQLTTTQTPARILIALDGSEILSDQAEHENPIAGLWFDESSAGSVLAGIAIVGFSASQSSTFPLRNRSLRYDRAIGLVLAGDNISVMGTWVGILPNNWIAKPNDYGIVIAGSGNKIGGLNDAERVVVSNNTLLGIEINELSQIRQEKPSHNSLHGVYVGTDPLGFFALPNGNGIRVYGNNNTIGGGSVISANKGFGVRFDGDGNQLIASRVGPNAGGAEVVLQAQQRQGVLIFGKKNVVNCSHIADNQDVGIFFSESSYTGRVSRSVIGTNAVGSAALGTQRIGIQLDGSQHIIGGDHPSAGNLISGHKDDGILFVAGEHTIQHNRIGTDCSGSHPIPNRRDGINVIGDISVLEDDDIRVVENALATIQDNCVSGNGMNGIRVQRGTAFIQNNLIGLNITGAAPLANQEMGILVDGPTSALISSNHVGYNGTDVDAVTSQAGIGVMYPAQAAILRTPSYANKAKGINIVLPKERRNMRTKIHPPCPELTTSFSFGNDLSIKGELNGALPQRTYRIEYFACEEDRKGITQGSKYIGTLDELDTDEHGNASFSVLIPYAHPYTAYVTATATLLADEQERHLKPVSTSEFSRTIHVK